jgi:hypothetical protein
MDSAKHIESARLHPWRFRFRAARTSLDFPLGTVRPSDRAGGEAACFSGPVIEEKWAQKLRFLERAADGAQTRQKVWRGGRLDDR